MIYKLGELFCGPGGLAYGAINADIGEKNSKIVHAWANDIDNTTCQTFALNIFKNPYTDKIFCEDVRNLEISKKKFRHKLTIFLFSIIIFLKSSRRKILFFSR